MLEGKLRLITQQQTDQVGAGNNFLDSCSGGNRFGRKIGCPY
jgi:hypothetical protein